MVKSADVVLAIFGATSALSALVLVFLGLVAGAMQSLPGGAAATVKRPYKIAAGVSFAAFLVGIACAGLSVWWLTRGQAHGTYEAVVATFIVQLILLAAASAQASYQLIFKQ
jgi:hypothetical protein